MAIRSRTSVNIISLCTGGYGLDFGIELAMPSARSVCLVEREAFAVARLVTAMRKGLIPEAAIWSDARSFNGRPWRGLVDGIIGGIPCQPHSLAGRRRGAEDPRDLWSTARRIIVQSGAWWCLIENVPGMLTAKGKVAGAERVWRDLQRLGFAVEGGLFSAAEVGASHERERLFILGVADRPGLGGNVEAWLDPEGHGSVQCSPRRHSRSGRSQDVANSLGRGRWREGDAGEQTAWADARGGDPMADADITGSSIDDGQREDVDKERAAADRVRRDVVDAASIGRREGWPEHEFRGGRRTVAVNGDELDVAACVNRQVDEPEKWFPQTDDRWPGDSLGNAISCRHNGRADDEIRTALVGNVVEGSGGATFCHMPLYPPQPGDADAWRAITEHASDLLPAMSRHDRFMLEIRNARLAAARHPEAQALDIHHPYGLHSSVIQEIAQSTLRRMADGMASRVDELRLLGNGVVSLAAANAYRTLVARLAARGSAGAAFLGNLIDHG